MAVINALSVNGGILALTALPGRDGDYTADLDHIQAWAPAIVLTLATPVEMFSAGAHELGAHLRERAMRWMHLPVDDFSAPGPTFETDWPRVSQDIRKVLSGGGRVLVHCRAGQGRSGMVALRLMIEAGEAPDEALARLRKTQPEAVETDAQMAWALQARRAPAQFRRHVEEKRER